MKNLLCLLFIMVALFSCKDDLDISDKNSHRLKQIITHDEDGSIGWGVECFYQDERLVKIIEKDGENLSEGDNKTEISYVDNSAMLKYFKYSSGSWEEESDYRMEIIIEDGLTKEVIEYYSDDGIMIESWKQVLQYSGEKLIAAQSFNFENGESEPSYKEDYIYEENLLSEVVEYDYEEGTWVQDRKTTFYYSGENISYLVRYREYDDSWEQYRKTEYSYVGDLVTATKVYYWDESHMDWELDYLYTYEYDEHGNLISETDDDGDREDYVYEEGHGNLMNLLGPEGYIYGRPSYKSGHNRSSVRPELKSPIFKFR